MSLLLEALKKAEKAKEEAQRRARSEGGEAPAGPSVEAEAEAPAAEAKPVLTRDKLPEITSQPLEILADEPPAPPPQQRPKPEAAKGEPAATERASARKVFEAKFREPNPRLPFYITLGVLGAFALGTVIYFWMQLRPPPPLVNTNPVRPAGEAPVEVASPPRPPVSAPVAQVAPLPGLPATPKMQEPARTPAPPPAELRARPPIAKPAPPAVEAPRLAAPEPRPAPPAPRPAPQVHPRVEAGYAAYSSGDLVKARTDYEEALRDEPGNRDAQFGLAALDVKAGRYEAAEAAYLRLLQANPRDAQAQAALIALRGARLDPLVAESRVKSLLAAEPRAHVLNFTLGNQLAQQGRWAEAQAEYFKAFSAEPDNADFAYNLAVSLDHIRQPRLALEYYRRAIALAEQRGAGFDLTLARNRAAQLEK